MIRLFIALCAACANRWGWRDDMTTSDACPACASPGTVRPDIVWFGEIPYHMERIAAALTKADLFVAIGTSGNVYPAAAYARHCRRLGARTVELNLEPSANTRDFDERRHGPASRASSPQKKPP